MDRCVKSHGLSKRVVDRSEQMAWDSTTVATGVSSVDTPEEEDLNYKAMILEFRFSI